MKYITIKLDGELKEEFWKEYFYQCYKAKLPLFSAN